MPVIDASVVVDALVGDRPRVDAARRELRAVPILPVPSLFVAEVTSALRGLVLRGRLPLAKANAARHRAGELWLVQYPFEPFARRIWDLRNDLSVYDAWYVALAEVLGTELVTTDARLARTPAARCPIRLA